MNFQPLGIVSPASEPWGTRLGRVVVLVGVAFLAHFLLFRSFGLYEDDYRSIAPWLGMTAQDLWHAIVGSFIGWPQGRPLNYAAPQVLAYVGVQLGGLPAMYLIGFAGLSVNVWLVFTIARRLFENQTAGFLTAVFYILYPADTTREFLTHCAHVQASMTYFLLAAWILLSERRTRYWAYAVASISLLSYETAYLLFILFPLLQARPTRKFAVRVAVHLGLCALTIGLDVVMRLHLRDNRMADMTSDAGHSLYVIVASPFYGFATSAGRIFGFLPDALAHVNLAGVGVAGLIAAMVAVFLWPKELIPAKTGQTALRRESEAREDFGLRWLGPFVTEAGPTSLGFVTVLLLQWFFSYCLSFTNFKPVMTIGRLTSVHMAAAFPVSLLLAQLCLLALNPSCGKNRLVIGGLLGLFLFIGLVTYLGHWRWSRALGVAVPATVFLVALVLLLLEWASRGRFAGQMLKAGILLYCALLGLYAFQIQRSYAMAWAQEQGLWRQLFALCPEISTGSTVVVYVESKQPTPFPDSKYAMQALCVQNLHIANIIFNHNYAYLPPPGEKSPYVAYLFPPNQNSPVNGYSAIDSNLMQFRETDGSLAVSLRSKRFEKTWIAINPDNLICLRDTNDHLERVDQLVIPGLSEPLQTRPPGGAQVSPDQSYTNEPLYRVLMQ